MYICLYVFKGFLNDHTVSDVQIIQYNVNLRELIRRKYINDVTYNNMS